MSKDTQQQELFATKPKPMTEDEFWRSRSIESNRLLVKAQTELGQIKTELQTHIMGLRHHAKAKDFLAWCEKEADKLEGLLQ